MRIATLMTEAFRHQAIVKHVYWKKTSSNFITLICITSSTAQKMKIPLNVSPINVTKFAVSCRFGQVLKKYLMESALFPFGTLFTTFFALLPDSAI